MTDLVKKSLCLATSFTKLWTENSHNQYCSSTHIFTTSVDESELRNNADVETSPSSNE